MRSVRRSLLATVLVAAMPLVAACGGDGASPTPTGTTSAGADPALVALVPADVAADGTLLFAVDASYPPNEYTDAQGEITGWGVDLGTAVAKLLGLEPRFVDVAQEDLIAAVRDGEYELGLASLTITPARAQQVDLVSYFRAGTSWAVQAGNPTGMSQNDACGLRVAVLRGSVQLDDLTLRSTLCARSSRSAIVIEPFEQQTDATAALLDGSVDATLADSPVIADAIRASDGKLAQLGSTYAVAPYGLAVEKGAGNLAIALRRAVQELIDGGTYEAILSGAGVQAGAITTSLIYPPAR
jgi:polar amino acid transport system substrate-binding protein